MYDAKLTSTQQQRIDQINELRNEGIAPYGERFDRTHSSTEAKSFFEAEEAKQEEKEHYSIPNVKVAGRIMTKRGQGKTTFLHILDQSGQLQLYIRKDVIGEEPYAIVKRLYAGDIIGAEGSLFKTKTGEISLRAEKITLLSKSVNPLPEKFHGLTDIELRYRQRYVDLIVNPEVRNTFEKRSQIVHSVRQFMHSKGFMEVETPMMHSIAGGAAARPFITHHNALDIDLYLRIAPELYLKRLIVGGFEKVFELNRNFRNEGMDSTHNPEFTMMEVYQAYGDMNTVMDLTEEIFCHAAKTCGVGYNITYQGAQIDLTPAWRRVKLLDLLKEATGKADLSYSISKDEALELAKKSGVDIEPGDTPVKLLVKIFDEKIEHTLIQPTFVYEYPKEISPLSKANKDNPDIVDRFELFINGKEFANAFSELNDSEDQLERFLDQLKQRESGDDEAHMMDMDYINALRYGMPPTGGLGIGIDRMVMLLTDAPSIRDVILFPAMKPLAAKEQ
ncbi:MAG: lysine--tRNA ligase [Candidatus Riflebacteria bacterium]|nr:lysine--tRNA ligase [Candidatus Riflebacteria bacterium]